MACPGWDSSLSVAVILLSRRSFFFPDLCWRERMHHVVWTPESLKRFATARLARIYPVYLVSLIVVSPFMIEMLTQPGWTGKQRSLLLTDYLLVLQGWTGSLNVGWNTPAWTLSCEFFFYLCFPFLFAPLRRARWMAIGVAMATAVAMPIVFDHVGVPWDWKPLYHTWDFVAGIAAARAFTLLDSFKEWRGRGYWFYIPATITGVWLIVHPHVVDGTGADLNTYLRPLNVALLIGLALGGGIVARFLSTKPADFLGKASYSMYVLHVPVLWWYPRYFLHGKWHFSLPMAAVIYLALVVGVSGLMFQWFEAPASTWIRGWQKRVSARRINRALAPA